MQTLAFFILLVLNLLGLWMMYIDKRKAVKKHRRIPERTLLALALLGGGIGSYLGMGLFSHKTQHLRFRILLPIGAVIAFALGYGIIHYL